MNVIVHRTLSVAFALAFIVNAHAAEALAMAEIVGASSGPHECGCSSGCACRSTDKDESRDRSAIRGRCSCGCSDPLHLEGPSTETIYTAFWLLSEPLLAWIPVETLGDSPVWRLAFEHEHPPRVAA